MDTTPSSASEAQPSADNSTAESAPASNQPTACSGHQPAGNASAPAVASKPKKLTPGQCAMLSLFVYPGAGQIALGQKSKGIAIIVIFTLFLVWWGIWVVLGLINSYSIITDGIDQKASSIETGLRYLKLSFIPGIIAGGLYIYSAADAYIGNGQAKEQ